MNILLLGYGKIGKAIEQIALSRNHLIPLKIVSNNTAELLNLKKETIDVAIEFSQPESAFKNIKICLEKGIPVVCGTTGWLEKKTEIENLCRANNGSFFYSSNYSLGVNIFSKLNRMLAKIMSGYPSYEVNMEEIHHAGKKDAPSGTAISLAEGILENFPGKTKWTNEEASKEVELSIISKRISNEPGTHTIFYNSPIDSIEIKHTAHTREGFAEGAVIAAEWLKGRTGIFSMDDMLK